METEIYLLVSGFVSMLLLKAWCVVAWLIDMFVLYML